MKHVSIAILGVTGAVGQAMLRILEEQEFPVSALYPLASSNTKQVMFRGEKLRTIAACDFDFTQAEIGLFSAGGEISKLYAPLAAKAGCLVIDNTSFFRYDNDVPLAIPEVNPEVITRTPPRGIIANPNCSTIQMLVALKPIYDRVGIKRIIVSTYQAVSGSGRAAIDELKTQSLCYLQGEPTVAKIYPQQIAFNVLPQIDVFQDNGYTREEMKMHWETQKILNDKNIQVNATCVRVPVITGHAESITIETHEPMSAAQARACLQSAPGVQLCADYPTPLIDAAGKDAVFVGRIREDFSQPNSLNLWCVADNVRKGAALNAVQIAQKCLRR